MTDRHPYPVLQASERAARIADRLLLVIAAVTIAAVIGGLL